MCVNFIGKNFHITILVHACGCSKSLLISTWRLYESLNMFDYRNFVICSILLVVGNKLTRFFDRLCKGADMTFRFHNTGKTLIYIYRLFCFDNNFKILPRWIWLDQRTQARHSRDFIEKFLCWVAKNKAHEWILGMKG